MENAISLKEFITNKGNLISKQIEKTLTPLYSVGGEDKKAEERINELLRTPFPVQKEIVKGLSKAMYQHGREKLFISGEMGCGKTILSLSVIYMSPRPLRVLVVCPGHLIEKWIREVKATIPDCETYDLATPKAITILETLRGSGKPQKYEFWIISKERAKLSYAWRAAYVTKKVKVKISGEIKFKDVLICPGCCQKIMVGDYLATPDMLQKKRHKCEKCKESLWQASNTLKRYAPAEYIKKYLKGVFDTTILDEIHDYKSGDTLQGTAMGQVVASSKYFMGLTGTLNGGYADNLFYLLYRIAPHELKHFSYSGCENWQKTYGVLETVQNLDDTDDKRYGRTKKKNVLVRKRPGVSPEVVGRYLLHRSCFVRLSDIIESLPPYEEHVVTLKMADEQKKQYTELQSDLAIAVKKYRIRAASSMLQALLSYPDSCVVFPENIKITRKDSDGDVVEVLAEIQAPKIETDLLPKEEELIKICKKEKALNRKVLCYITFTGTRDIRQRIKTILEKEKFRVGILPESIEPKKREAWIEKHKGDFDVLLVNPELVKVGLDLYDYPTVVFFEVGYNIFTLRQAARRSWRIGQKQPVNVYFLCYQNTMQETALYLIARKIEVAMIVEGDLPEGIAEQLENSGSLVEEMAKSLVEGKHYSGAEAAWANMRRKEIESQLSITDKESIFTAVEKTSVAKIKEPKLSISSNTMISVSVIEGKNKKVSKLSVKYGELESIAKDKIVQFAMF